MLVLGRQGGEEMAQAWPSSQSPTGELMNSLPKVVFSSTLTDLEWRNAHVTDRPVEEEIPELKDRPGKDIVVFGGVSFARSLAAHGLIDEYRIKCPTGRARQRAAAAARTAGTAGAGAGQQHRLGRRTHHPDLRIALRGAHREDVHMARVICDMSTSLDGYVTGPNDSRENPFGDGAEILHDWIFDAATDEDRAILQDVLDNVGAIVMGRKSFDKNEGDGGWGEGGPVGDTPCFVVTHHKPTRSHPPIYTFVTDGVVRAIEQAKQAAGDSVVGLHGASVMQQALPLGLVDEIRVHVIPVLLGAGTPLFATLDSAISLERTQAVVTPATTHLGFRVVR
jgi:dihydrofolate reductase